MGGYLGTYGASDTRREQFIKRLIGSVIVLALLGSVAWFYGRTWQEEKRISQFLEHLRAGNYKQAHALWGCTDATPCRDYSYEKFLEDWGPRSPYANASDLRVGNTILCDASVVQTLQKPGVPDVQLRVDRKDENIGYTPWPITLQEGDSLALVRRFFARVGLGSCAPRTGGS